MGSDMILVCSRHSGITQNRGAGCGSVKLVLYDELRGKRLSRAINLFFFSHLPGQHVYSTVHRAHDDGAGTGIAVARRLPGSQKS